MNLKNFKNGIMSFYYLHKKLRINFSMSPSYKNGSIFGLLILYGFNILGLY